MNKRIVIAVIVLLMMLLPAGTAWLILHSTATLHWAITRVENRYPGRLKIGGIDGTLAGPVRLTDVHIDEAAFAADIGTLEIGWQPLALLTGSLDITRLRAQDVEVRIKPRHKSSAFRVVRPRPPYLPVALIVADLQVTHLRLTAPQLKQPVLVDRAGFTAHLDNRAWSIHSLRAGGQSVRIAGGGSWEFQHAEQVQAELQWQLTLPQQPAFIGQARLSGDEQALRLTASLDAPFRLLVTSELHHMFTAPSWHGSLEFSELDPQRLRPGWPKLTVGGKLDFHGDPSATVTDGNVSAHQEKYGDWRSHVDMRWAHRVLAIRRLDLDRVRNGTRFNLSGKLAFSDGKLKPELHGEWRALTLPLTGKSWFSSPRGYLEIHTQDQLALLNLTGILSNGGNFDGHAQVKLSSPHSWHLKAHARNFQLAVRSFDKGTLLPVMNWRLQAHGDGTQTQVDSFASTWLSGRLLAKGTINHTDGQPWQFSLLAQGIDPAVIYPEFPGALAFRARISGRLSEPSVWKFQLSELDGQLRKRPVRASGTLEHVAAGWKFQNAFANIGGDSLRLDGRYGKLTHITWQLEAPDLSGLWPDITGSLSSHGSLDLTGSTPALRLTLNGRAIRYRDYAVGKITATTDTRAHTQTGSASLDAESVQINDFKIDSLTAHANGSPSAHALTGKFSSPYGDASLVGNGAFSDGVWRAEFRQIALMPRAGGQWHNQGPWQIRIGAQRLSLPKACVNQGAAQACLQADWRPQQWSAEAMLEAVPMRDLQALLPEGLEYQGSFGGTLQVQGADESRMLDVTASLSPGAVHNVINRKRVTLLAYTSGRLKVHSDTRLTSAHLDWTLSDGGYMDIDSLITHGQQPAISGSIQGEMHQFDLVPALIPAVGGLDGLLKINLKLDGTPTDPRFMGSASLINGTVLIPRFGLHVTGISLNLNGNGEQLELNGKAQSGKGNLDWQSSALRTGEIWHAHGKLRGENFRVADIPEAQIDVSPDIDFKLDNHDVYLDGALDVPYAKLRPRDLSHTAQVSPDQVIVGENGEPSPAKWRVHAQVRVNMGADVDLAGFGLSGHIKGGVLAVDEPGHYTTGNGELQIVDGQYAAYGQKLKIDRGRLMFNGGPISNPSLDIRAIRPSAHPETVLPGTNEQTVGVLVRGTLRDPKVTLFSNPPLPQSQLLTYLLTGQAPVSQSSSPLVGAPPTTASTSLALTGGQLLANEVGQEVGQHVGIEDVGVQSVSTGPGTSTAALFFGRYLSPRLYVSYGVGLLQPLNTIRIRYTLSARWMLEAESGSFANSADLIYTIEH